MLDVYSVYC